MIKRVPIIFLAGILLLTALPAEAYWVWSPDLGKWVNPKKVAKDTPEDQFAWAMQFFEKEEWDRAVDEFDKLADAFPNSRLAAEGVYYKGLAWEKREDYAKAADAYQNLIDHYPYSDRIKDAIRREFDIAGAFAGGDKMKLLGVPVLSGQEKALELYQHIVKNAPYGSYGDQAQYQIGEIYKRQGEFELAQKAYQQVVDEYPSSDLASKARYQIAYCSMLASQQITYNEENAQRAIEEFESFRKNYPDEQLSVEADESIRLLRVQRAETGLETARFYEKLKKYKSARIYYEEVAQKYPETAAAEEAKLKADELLQRENQPQKSGFRLKLW